MDFQYTFRQAHQDRLEDAGVKRYEPKGDFEARREEKQTVVKRVRVVLATIINLMTK